MIPELGHFALVLAFILAVGQGVLPLAGAATGRNRWMQAGASLAAGQFVFLALAFMALTYSFIVSDFSVAYVRNNSNSLLPVMYKVSAVWGAHEGSFLLWTLIMSGWTVAVAVFGRSLPWVVHARVLGIMGLLSVGFIAFMLWTSNPFLRNLPNPPLEGADLNPLLQDFGLIIHPPMLYVGYVGFSVAFAFAIAALMGGRLDAAWARWSRPWTNAAWAFLTCGIALGSWWAYYELGWGGWWFWDPVENASFMPWLVGTALIHSLAVTEKRGIFKSWTVLLAIMAFSLALLGAFIVRSGVLTSVHAFAVDPTRGLFILVFLILIVGGSLTLYGLRAGVISSRASFTGLSREVLLLLNNLLLVIAMAVVFAGTLSPLLYEAVTGGSKISVGPQYFNPTFLGPMALLAVLLALGPAARWKRTDPRALARELAKAAVVALVLGSVVPLLWFDAVSWQVVVACTIATWIIATHLQDLVTRWRAAGHAPPAAWWGMWVAHNGFAITILGVCLTSHFTVEKDLAMNPGQSYEVGGITVRFDGVRRVEGPNYVADQGLLSILDADDGTVAYELRPEKRRYVSGGSVMTEAAIQPSFLGDVYVALGEPVNAAGGWSVRVHLKPFVRWIWGGALLMALGGLLALADKRYRRLAAKDAARQTPPDTATAPGPAAEGAA